MCLSFLDGKLIAVHFFDHLVLFKCPVTFTAKLIVMEMEHKTFTAIPVQDGYVFPRFMLQPGKQYSLRVKRMVHQQKNSN